MKKKKKEKKKKEKKKEKKKKKKKKKKMKKKKEKVRRTRRATMTRKTQQNTQQQREFTTVQREEGNGEIRARDCLLVCCFVDSVVVISPPFVCASLVSFIRPSSNGMRMPPITKLCTYCHSPFLGLLVLIRSLVYLSLCNASYVHIAPTSCLPSASSTFHLLQL